jgi:hypothetical protein
LCFSHLFLLDSFSKNPVYAIALNHAIQQNKKARA